ncbi:MAG: acyltransferase [Verrucomicrobia bacterium]|nr:acyltransferase [Verrucomicrobiota bacterium]
MPDALPPELSPAPLLSVEELRRGLRHCGTGVKVFRGCRIFPPEQVSLGDFTQVDEGVWLLAGEGTIRIGRHVHLAFGSSVSGGGSCEIGDFAGIGAGVRLITGSEVADGSGLTNPTVPPDLRVVRRGAIRVGAHALVYTGAIVLPDVEIGEGAVVGAGCVVHRSLKPWAVYAGHPLIQVGVRPADRILELAKRLSCGRAGYMSDE